MDRMVFCPTMFSQIMYLCMTVVACGDAVIGLCGQDLVELRLPVLTTCINIA